jgi:hypothetical protein
MATTSPKGFTQIQNTDGMAGPAQINAAEEFVEGLIDPVAAAPSNLPSSGNWDGREIWVTSALQSYRWIASAGQWCPRGLVAQGSVSSTDFGTTRATGASVAVSVIAGVDYKIHGYCLGNQVTNPGIPTIRLTAAGAELARLVSGETQQSVNATALVGDASPIYTATATGTVTFAIDGVSTASAYRAQTAIDVIALI